MATTSQSSSDLDEIHATIRALEALGREFGGSELKTRMIAALQSAKNMASNALAEAATQRRIAELARTLEGAYRAVAEVSKEWDAHGLPAPPELTIRNALSDAVWGIDSNPLECDLEALMLRDEEHRARLPMWKRISMPAHVGDRTGPAETARTVIGRIGASVIDDERMCEPQFEFGPADEQLLSDDGDYRVWSRETVRRAQKQRMHEKGDLLAAWDDVAEARTWSALHQWWGQSRSAAASC